MSEFILDHGTTEAATAYKALDAFTQGYIEAAFFTSCGPDSDDLANATFADVSPSTLAAMVADCEAFLNTPAWRALGAAQLVGDDEQPDDAQAGRDFWYTRNGHGCGFWDGGWDKPHSEALTAAAKGFSEVNLYRGDDGLIYA